MKENIRKNQKTKKYDLMRWKIKRFLVQEKNFTKCINWKTILDIFDSEILNKDNLIDLEIKEMFIRNRTKIIKHHTKYKEIHGIDESIYMTRSEHRTLHNRLRREGKCNIPSEELTKISTNAGNRGDRHLSYAKEYNKTDKMKKYRYEYTKANEMRIITTKTMARNIIFYEEISYNNRTNTLTVSSGFTGGHGFKIPTMKID